MLAANVYLIASQLLNYRDCSAFILPCLIEFFS